MANQRPNSRQDIEQFEEGESTILPRADASSFFLATSGSYDFQQFSNLKDTLPEWDDDEIDEIVVLSPKKRKTSSIPEYWSPGKGKFTIEQLKLLRVLPTAQRSSVSQTFLVEDKHSSKQYALKIVRKLCLSSLDSPILERAMTEQMVSRLLTWSKARFIQRLVASFQDDRGLYFVLDYCQGGDLQSFVHTRGPLNLEHIKTYAAEILDGITNLHLFSIIHNALTPSAILIDHDGHIVLGDFSYASISSSSSPQDPLDAAARSSRTNIWCAPEIILGWTSTGSVDIWGLGLVLGYMLTCKHLFFPATLGTNLHLNCIESIVLHGQLDIPSSDDAKGRDKQAFDLCNKCLQRNPSLRPTIEEIKAHSYFADLDWCRLREKRYPVPEALRANEYKPSSEETSPSDLPVSESLTGIYVDGFDFVLEEELSTTNPSTPASDDTEPSSEKLINTQPYLISSCDTIRDNIRTVGDVLPIFPRSSGDALATTNESVLDATSQRTPSVSTAVYSCTSFGELREKHEMQTAARSDAQPTQGSRMNDSLASDKQTNSRFTIRASPAKLASSSLLCPKTADDSLFSSMADTSLALSRDDNSHNTTRGFGLRKYASLNFELDTVVSLDQGFERDLNHLDVSDYSRQHDDSLFSETTPIRGRPRTGMGDRTMSLAEFLLTPLDGQGISTNKTQAKGKGQDKTEPGLTNTSILYSPVTPNANGNKLQKRRTTSTPVLSSTLPNSSPFLFLRTPTTSKQINVPKTPLSVLKAKTPQRMKSRHAALFDERANTPAQPLILPAGVEQIGLGIGYTCPPKHSVKLKTQTPRRSTSLSTSFGAGVAKAKARLFRQGVKGQSKGVDGQEERAREGRGSEESVEASEGGEGFEYRGRWSLDMSPGRGGGSGLEDVFWGERQERAGAVYPVYGARDNSFGYGAGSTLRLVGIPKPEEG